MQMNDGTVYGPADLNRLQTWAREGRIASSSQISSDRKSWAPASLMPELGMEWVVEVEQGQYYGPFHQDVIRDLIDQKRVPASARRFRLDTGRAQEDRSEELNAALEKEKALVVERDAALAEARSLVAERDAALAGQMAALEAERGRVENLLAQLVSAAEREKALRADLDLAHKTAASERKCAEAAIRQKRQTEKELEDARKDAEDLRVKMQKAKAAKGRGGLFQGASAAELAFLEQAARRELASARGRSASVPRPQPKALDVIDI